MLLSRRRTAGFAADRAFVLLFAGLMNLWVLLVRLVGD